MHIQTIGSSHMGKANNAIKLRITLCALCATGAFFSFLSIRGFGRIDVLYSLLAFIGVFALLYKSRSFDLTALRCLHPTYYVIASLSVLGLLDFYNSTIELSYRSLLGKLGPIINAAQIAPQAAKALFIIAVSLIAACALFFLFIALLVFWRKTASLLLKVVDYYRKEAFSVRVYLGVLLFVTVFYVAFVYGATTAFYGPGNYNVIYEGDSEILFKTENAFLSLFHNQNDIRQPLFAVFSIPLLSAPYLISNVIAPGNLTVLAELFGTVQVVLLFVGVVALAQAMRLNGKALVLFVSLCCVTYTYMLSSLLLEQYVIAFFYLALLVLRSSEKRPDYFFICCAAGTLLPSILLVPILYSNRGLRNCLKISSFSILAYLLMLIAFCRLDVIASLLEQLSTMIGVASDYDKIPLLERIFRYFAFVSNVAIAPNAGIGDGYSLSFTAWLIQEDNFALPKVLEGVVLTVLAILGFLLNRSNRLCQISILWICFSFLLLPIIGWGSILQGFIPYVLYFSWAFCILWFNLMESLFINKAHSPKMRTIAVCLFMALFAFLGVFNFWEINQMVFQIAQYYPI